jgi:hypothetical protein
MFPNGATAVLIDGQQVPELQHPWFLAYIDFLLSKGHDPTTFTFHLPGGNIAELFRTSDGSYNWKNHPR